MKREDQTTDLCVRVQERVGQELMYFPLSRACEAILGEYAIVPRFLERADHAVNLEAHLRGVRAPKPNLVFRLSFRIRLDLLFECIDLNPVWAYLPQLRSHPVINENHRILIE